MKQNTSAPRLLVSEVARRLGLSAAGVKLHDAALQPERVCGMRVYDAAIVEEFAAQREAKRAAREGSAA